MISYFPRLSGRSGDNRLIRPPVPWPSMPRPWPCDLAVLPVWLYHNISAFLMVPFFIVPFAGTVPLFNLSGDKKPAASTIPERMNPSLTS
jgi:hypothetical protein